MGFYTARYAGLTPYEAMYDYEKMTAAYVKFHEDLQPDFQADPIAAGPVFDKLEARMLNWPGHGVDEDTPWQYIEKEYMKAEDYDALIRDPSAYFMRTLVPQFADAFSGLAKLDPISDINEAAFLSLNILGFADPEVVESINKLAAAANATFEFLGAFMAMSGEVTARLGMPAFWGPTIKAPYDCIADTLRGTRGIVMDRYRQPDKIIQAAERFAPLQIDFALRQMFMLDCPLVCFPLHKGADGFMSDADFRTFYWPTLKAVVLAMIAEGLVPVLFAEGGYNERLQAIADDDIPAGSVVWFFDQTDMQAAYDTLKGYACIAGNVPSAMLALGTAEEVHSYATSLMDRFAKDGGFILGSGGVIDDAKPETMKALLDAPRTWGA